MEAHLVPIGRAAPAHDAGTAVASFLDADLHVVPGGHAPWFHHADRVAGLTQEFLRARR